MRGGTAGTIRSAMAPTTTPPPSSPRPSTPAMLLRTIFASHDAPQMASSPADPTSRENPKRSSGRRRPRTWTQTLDDCPAQRWGLGGPGGYGVDGHFDGWRVATSTTMTKGKSKSRMKGGNPSSTLPWLLILMAWSSLSDLLRLSELSSSRSHFTWSPRPVLAEVVASTSPPTSSSFSPGHLRDRYRKYLATATTPSSLYTSSTTTSSSPGAVIGGRGGTRTCGAGSKKKTALCPPEAWGSRDRPYHPPRRREGGGDDESTGRLCATLIYGDEWEEDSNTGNKSSSSTSGGVARALMLFERLDETLDSSATGSGIVNGTDGTAQITRCVSISRGEGNRIIVRPCHMNHPSVDEYRTTGQAQILRGGGRRKKGRPDPSSLKNETTRTVAGHHHRQGSLRNLNGTSGRRRKDVAPDAPSMTTWTSVPSSSAIVDVEGIYGVYNLPSGPHLVLILESEGVYSSPPPPPPPPDPNLVASTSASFPSCADTVEEPPPLLNLRRVVRMDVVPIPGGVRQHKFAKSSSSSSSARRREEARQLRLLRRALRSHDLYYSPSPPHHRYRRGRSLAEAGVGGDLEAQHEPASSAPRCDATNTLQRRLLIHTTGEGGAGDDGPPRGGRRLSTRRRGAETWERVKRDAYRRPPGRRHAEPDSRFFWNEDLLPPLFEDCGLHSEGGGGGDEGAEADEAADFSGGRSEDEYCDDDGDSVARILGDWVIPCTSAFVGVARDVSPPVVAPSGVVQPPVYDEVLISRRSRRRAGTRFTRRGADSTGAVANYAETEQLIFVKTNSTAPSSSSGGGGENGDDTASPSPRLAEVYGHVQTRGSIPLLWSSPADVRTYTPRVRMGIDPLAQARALRAHVMEQIRLYSIRPPPRPLASSLDNGVTDRNGLDVDEDDDLASASSSGTPTVTFVNLVDKKHDQGRLGRAFDAVLGAVVDVHSGGPSPDEGDGDEWPSPPSGANNVIPTGSVRHVWFDFHAECKGGRWHRLKGLLSSVQSDLDGQGYLAAVPSWSIADGRGDGGDDGESEADKAPSFSWKIVALQRGVVRTNCMDCLDRTNVVQSIFGRYVLFRQLQRRDGRCAFLSAFNNAGDASSSITQVRGGRTLPLEWVVASKRDPLRLPWIVGETAHRHLWADNADAISRLYAGTRALKGDFTRTGVRTKRGAMEDGVNSLTRYYLNNFADADRQEGVDLVTGTLPFANVDDCDEDGVVAEGVVAGGVASSVSAMAGSEPGDDDISTTHERSVMLGRVSRQPTCGSSQMKGEVSEELDLLQVPEDPIKPVANEDSAIDGRAASDLPWWIGEGDDDDSSTPDREDDRTTEIGTEDTTDQVALNKPQRTVFAEEPADRDSTQESFFVYPKGGYVLGALLAMSNASVAAAAAILLILLPGLSTLDEGAD